MIESVVTQGIVAIALVSGLPLLAAALASLLVSLFLTSVQVQEQTTIFLARFVAISAVATVGGGYSIALLLRLFETCFAQIGALHGG